MPENAGTFRIVGIVRDAKFAGWGLRRQRVRCSTSRSPRTSTTPNPLCSSIELQSHFIGGLMLVTNTPAGTLEPLAHSRPRRGGSQPDYQQRHGLCATRSN